MKNQTSILLNTLLIFFASGAAYAQHKPEPGLKTVRSAINASNQLYSRGFETHQEGLVVDRYTEDAEIMAPNMNSISTAKGFSAFFNGGYQQGIRKVAFQTTELFGFTKNMVNEQGLYQLLGADGQILDSGKYIVVWKKTAGGWKMFRDIFNTNLPAAH